MQNRLRIPRLVLGLLSVAAWTPGSAGDEPMLDVFPPSTYTAPKLGEAGISYDFSPSEGPWEKGLVEEDVFQAELTHQQGPMNSYKLRVGAGGQIYSLVGPFGESVPPSYRRGNNSSPWNDEVWQFVGVCTRYNNRYREGREKKGYEWLKEALPYDAGHFIHNSGAYIRDKSLGINNLYCPMLGYSYDAESRVYRQINWGLVSHTKTINRSPLLYYMQVRDAGEGVIELTWVVHNFSVRDDLIFDHLNTPWGGTRMTSLPEVFTSQPSGELQPLEPQTASGSIGNGIDVRKTGGFYVTSAQRKASSPALALVYGLDKHRDEQLELARQGKPHFQNRISVFRGWRASVVHYENRWKDWKTMPEEDHRNYDVAVMVPKIPIKPGDTFWYRSYLVVDSLKKATVRSKQLVDHVDYGMLTFEPRDTPMNTVNDADGQPLFKLFSKPVPGTLPVFSLRHKPTGQTALTTDAYFFTPQEKLSIPVPEDHKDFDYYSQAVGYSLDGQTEYLGLLGFAYREDPGQPGWAPLSTHHPSDRPEAPSAFYDVDVYVAAP